MIKLYNTLSRKKEIFKPLEGKKVNFYVCGPTVYGPGHLGHARTYIAFDIIRRYLEYRKYKVKYVMNITDVHDDIIKSAIKEKTDIFSLGNKYSDLFLKEQKNLGIKPADFYPRVTQHIEQIIDFIQKLEKKGSAYEKDGSVYFDVSKFKDYGKLSKIKLKEAKSGTRVNTDKYEREEAVDFVLWKKAKPDEPSWPSPWGNGRPGWHIECSVMNKEHLAEQIDIHGGARDLMFPHHENEIAQTESLTGKPFVKYWLHGGLLLINGQKMSKSLGNYITITDVLKRWNFRIIRMLVASSLYQSELNWSEKNLFQAKQNIARIDEFITKIEKIEKQELRKNKKKINKGRVQKIIKGAKDNFEKAMDDNFNTPKALSAIFEFIRQINQFLNQGKIGQSQAKNVLRFLKNIDKVFNFIFENKKVKIPDNIKNLVDQRNISRKEKKWEEADRIRQEIEKLGFEIKDTPKGATIRKK